eukprot:8506123-Pyramimonas_sp.AAC.1
MLKGVAANVCSTSERVSPLDVVRSKASACPALHARPSLPNVSRAVSLATLRQTAQDSCMSAVEKSGGFLGKDGEMVMLSLLVQHELAQHLDGTHLDLPSSGLPVDPLALMDTLCGSTRRVILARTALMVDTPQNDRNT